MRKSYRYSVIGSGAEGATFETSGTVMCELIEAFPLAMQETFRQLTNGRAVYGNPGIGCRGPYDIHRVTIDQVPQ